MSKVHIETWQKKRAEVLLLLNLPIIVSCIPYGLAVRIPGFHPGGPGSTPGMGTHNIFLFSF